jgi:Ran GTPase-activating protein (RanGAP) involved in mRNA processing and transport
LGEALHSLFAATHLVTFNIMDPIVTESQCLIIRAIQASSRSLRAISLQHLVRVERKEDELTSRFFLTALLSCTSLRFLRLGDYPFIGSASMAIHELIELVTPLPIEFLSLVGAPGTIDYFTYDSSG